MPRRLLHIRVSQSALRSSCCRIFHGSVTWGSGTYEWVVRGTPYVIAYEIHHGGSDELMVLGVFRGTQDRP
jgi:hypothetical protein